MVTSYLVHTIKSLHQIIRLKDYSGKRVAIDGHTWLFQCALMHAAEILINKNTKAYIDAFFSLIDFLRGYGVVPVVVFDGKVLACNRPAEKQRQRARDAEKSKGLTCLIQSKQEQTTRYLQKSVHVTQAMMQRIIEQLDAEKIEHIVAPYETLTSLKHVDTVTTDNACETLFLGLGNDGKSKQRVFKDPGPAGDMTVNVRDISSARRLTTRPSCPEMPAIPDIDIKTTHDKNTAATFDELNLKYPIAPNPKAFKKFGKKRTGDLRHDQAAIWNQPGFFSSDNKENIPPWLEQEKRRPDGAGGKRSPHPRTHAAVLGKRVRHENMPEQSIKRPRQALHPSLSRSL